MNKFSGEAFAGYLAGFLDGEGSIEIHPNECGVRIRLANTHKATLDAMQKRLGIGTVQAYNRPKKYKQLYAYAICNANDCRTFLYLVEPYTTVKAKRVRYALDVIARMQKRMDDIDERNRQILAAIESGEKQKDIGARFGISQALVSRIKLGHTWPCEIRKLNAKKGLKKNMRPKDAVFRLHGDPMQSPCETHEELFPI